MFDSELFIQNLLCNDIELSNELKDMLDLKLREMNSIPYEFSINISNKEKVDLIKAIVYGILIRAGFVSTVEVSWHQLNVCCNVKITGLSKPF